MRNDREQIAAIVASLCRDYVRRREAIRRKSVSRRTEMEYRYLNACIAEAAREAVGDALAFAFIREIGARRGYAHSDVDCMAEATYKEYKARAVYCIARRLHLVD